MHDHRPRFSLLTHFTVHYSTVSSFNLPSLLPFRRQEDLQDSAMQTNRFGLARQTSTPPGPAHGEAPFPSCKQLSGQSASEILNVYQNSIVICKSIHALFILNRNLQERDQDGRADCKNGPTDPLAVDRQSKHKNPVGKGHEGERASQRGKCLCGGTSA